MFGRGRRQVPDPGPARLTAVEAAEIAQAAVEDPLLRPTLTHATVANVNGALVWTVAAVALGRTPIIEIDDATGAIRSSRWAGVR